MVNIGIILLSTAIGMAVGLVAGRTKPKTEKEFQRLVQEKAEHAYYSDFWYREYQDASGEAVELYNKLSKCEQELSEYKQAYKELLKRQTSTNTDKDVLEAIKFAMKNSHPDKPSGSQEDFIRFHGLYKKYCK